MAATDSPAIALPRLLRAVEENIALRRSQEAKLAETFAPLMALDAERAAVPDAPMITVLLGFQRINDAIGEAMSTSSTELLTIQPGGHRPAPCSPRPCPRSSNCWPVAAGCGPCTSTRHATRRPCSPTSSSSPVTSRSAPSTR